MSPTDYASLKDLHTRPPTEEYAKAFAKWHYGIPETQPVAAGDWPTIRANMDVTYQIPLMRWFGPRLPKVGSYLVEDHSIPVDEGMINIRIVVPNTGKDSYPLLVYAHGGAFYGGNLNWEDYRLRDIAVECGVSIVNVEYRLAPQHPFPTGMNDTVTALKWAVQNAKLLKFSPEKGVILGGTSAGAGVASGAMQSAMENSFFADAGVKFAGSLMCQPMLIDPEAYPEEYKADLQSLYIEKYVAEATMDEADIRKYYKLYGGRPTDPKVSPLLFKPLSALPPVVVQVVGLDPVCDEALLYARLSEESGVKTQLYSYAGVPHCHFQAFPELKESVQFMEDTKAGVSWMLEQV